MYAPIVLHDVYYNHAYSNTIIWGIAEGTVEPLEISIACVYGMLVVYKGEYQIYGQLGIDI